MVSDKQKQIEKKWQNKWNENKTFEPKIDNKKEKYFATIAYPYANSVMHIGHGRTSTTCDIYTRYQRILGKNAIYPMGFHITGTPVLAVSDGIAKGDEKQIRLTREAISDYVKDKKGQDDLIETFKDPMNIAKYFSSKIEETFNSVGLGIDWSRQFTTGDEAYNKFIEWQFQKLHDKGILTRGKYPILYSPVDKNAVGEDDIKDGDTEKVTLQEMNYILFQLKDTNEYLVICTLRPDALFGTTNMWVDSKMDLIKVQVENKTWVISKDALVKVENQFDNVKVISEHKGKEFIGKTAIAPIVNREVLIAEASFIDSNHGTGIVYSSPAGAPHDYIALVDAKKEKRLPETIQVINTVITKDKKGNIINYNASCPAENKCNKFKVKDSKSSEGLEQAKQELYKEEHYGGVLNENAGEFEGVPIKYAKDKVAQKLKDLELGGIFYETSRRAKTRGNDQVIVAILDEQWFLDYTKDETKQVAFDVLDNMKYNPHKMRPTQRGYLEWVQMRPCARKRGLGTKLPFDKEWVIEALSDSTIYQMFYLMAKTIYKENIPAKKLTLELFDYVLLGKGDINKLDIDEKLINEMRSEVKYWKSFDLRYTAAPHMSNHLSFLIYHYGLIFEKEYWPKCITIGGLLTKDGEKIAKSKGNGIPLFRIKDIYGADLYRLYVGVGANYDIEMDFKDTEILQLEKKFEKWQSLIEYSIKKPIKKYDEFSDTNKWLISKFYSRTKEYFNYMDDFRIREAYVSVLYELLNDINYHERRTSNEETLEVIRFIAQDYLILMTPVIPHICEELNEQLGNKSEISLTKFETKIEDYMNKKAEDIEEIGQSLINIISRTKDIKQLSHLKKITIVQAKEARFKLFDRLKELLSNTKDIKTIFGELNKDFSEDKKFIQKFVPKTLGEDGLSNYLSREDEKKFITSMIDFLKKTFNCEIVIDNADNLEIDSNNCIPREPSIILE
ncbi:MAG: leucine--tRNA ligase [Candidatus Woesearchaeota archaeon]|jgi:leucyl-tRNA synthetase|nr:leucine--tRNA ligase [Candidatus Woesearchaeota archaeon]